MAEPSALSVSAALSLAKRQLEEITVKVIGEVSEVSINARYKAVYFTIKDKSASMPCMMWNNRYSASGVELRVGALVELTGRFTLYAAKGRMNFDVFSLALAGEGTLRMQVANLAKKLEAEGLMNPARKRALPALPERIGLVTSPRGAAVFDVLRTLRRRYPLAQVIFAGVNVEGTTAPAQMIEALHTVEDAGAEVILLVRGGGSFEDLMPFNDEGLARTVASLSVPVVTGIGHEPDTSIADMVSDLRASTPTAAAESVAPSRAELESTLARYASKMHTRVSSSLHASTLQLGALSSRPLFRDPTRLFENEAQQADDLARRISQALPATLATSRQKLDYAARSLASSLARFMPAYHERLGREKKSLLNTGPLVVRPEREHISLIAASLNAYSPLGVLARGYSIAMNKEGRVVKTVSGIKAHDNLDVRVSDGLISCEVISTNTSTYALEDIDE